MRPRPITRQRSLWEPAGVMPLPGGYSVDAQHRRVSDGTLRALVGLESGGWHLSISFVNHKGEPSRYPTWDEIAHARQELLPAAVGFVMHLPPADEYVAVHEHPPRTSDASGSTTAGEAT